MEKSFVKGVILWYAKREYFLLHMEWGNKRKYDQDTQTAQEADALLAGV